MIALAELIISLIDLAKAEVEQSKRGLVRFLVGVVLVAAGGLLLVGAFGMILAAIVVALRLVIPMPLALLMTGFMTLVLAGIVVWIGTLSAKR
ncbi:MAG: phage holin family protein [Candidatus Sumerlaeia bacterium]